LEAAIKGSKLETAIMRIAMIHTPFRARAGGERQILKLAIELERMGHEVEIFTNGINEDSYPEFFNKVNVNVIPFPLAGKLPRALTPQIIAPKIRQISHEEAEGALNLRKWMRKARERVLRQYYASSLPLMLELGRKIPKRFDIINNHNFPTEWAGFIAKKRLKVPLVWMCNEPPYWFFAPEERRGLHKINWPLFELLDKTTVKYIDEIMVLSHVSEEYVRKAYNRSSRIVRTGVDVELFHNATGENLRREHDLENSFVLLCVGGSKYVRRADIIRALANMSKKHDNIRLIIDTAREREMLTSLSEELGLRNKVLLLNSTSDLELAEVYAACDVFVYPSSASPWGLVVTEAMAAAKPVIVSKQVGTSEIIQDYVNGIVIDRAKPDNIAKQVEMLINDPKLRKKLGENAYEYVKNNLSWERYAKNVESVFQETI
jgi:glycosyltransferase involved in cell wall biosynthesis